MGLLRFWVVTTTTSRERVKDSTWVCFDMLSRLHKDLMTQKSELNLAD